LSWYFNRNIAHHLGATRLVRLTQLSAVTALTELVTGRTDNEAYSGASQRAGRGGEA